MGLPMFTVVDGKIGDWNSAARLSTGWSSGEMLGHFLSRPIFLRILARSYLLIL
jgi:hypothetical protein